MEAAVSTQDPRHGDYQSNFAFRVGKALRTNPRAVAEQFAAAMPEHPAVEKVEVAGPGFLNFTLSETWLGEEVARRAVDPRFATPTPGAGRSLVIDYSSPNIAKRMHVGHMRSTIIGNALDRIFRFVGFDVISDNHIGDWGTQFGKLIYAWHHWRDEDAYAADAIGELQRLYKRFGDVSRDDADLMEQARAHTARLQEGEPEHRALWERFVEVSMAEFAAVYERLGIRFDVTLGESAYRDDVGPLVDDLLERGIAERSEGAVIVSFSPEDGKGLSKSPLLIRKRDGAALYGTTDLATVRHRESTWSPDTIVYVTDTRQQLHFRQLFAASRKMGYDLDFRHVWFGMLRFADGSIAATRGGGPMVNLVDVLDEAERRAREVVDSKSPHLSEEERAAIAAAVGIGAVKYADLSQNPQSDITFEWDKMLSLQGNTAPYLMYAHARCHSILRKSGQPDFVPATIAPSEPFERGLAIQLLRLPEAILLAAHTNRPNLLAEHLYQLATAFGRFYDECPVLKDDVAADVRSSRLGLVRATATALAAGLNLLGIEPLRRM